MRDWWKKYWGGPFTVLAIPVGVFMARGFYKLYWLIPWTDPSGKPDSSMPGVLALASVAAIIVTTGFIVNAVVNAEPHKPEPPKPKDPEKTDWR